MSLLTAGPQISGLLTAPSYENFADLAPFMADTFGADASAVRIWGATDNGIVFPAPPFSNVPIYAPDGLLPPGQFYAGSSRLRVPMLAGQLREGFTPFDVLPGTQSTTQTLNQVRNMSGGNKVRGSAGERYIAQQSGGSREVTYDLPAGMSRRTDVASPSSVGTIAQEVKTYQRYIGGPGGTVREVPLTAFLQSEINRDAMIMYNYVNHQPVWVFINAPPSAELVSALREAGIPYSVMSDRLPFQ
jgi:hypothetical protein